MVIRGKIVDAELQGRANRAYAKAVSACFRWNVPICRKINKTPILIKRNTCYAITYQNKDSFVICLSTMTIVTYPQNADEAMFNYFLHELLHTVEGCFNHGRKWKEWVLRLNREHGTNLNHKPYSSKPHATF